MSGSGGGKPGKGILDFSAPISRNINICNCIKNNKLKRGDKILYKSSNYWIKVVIDDGSVYAKSENFETSIHLQAGTFNKIDD